MSIAQHVPPTVKFTAHTAVALSVAPFGQEARRLRDEGLAIIAIKMKLRSINADTSISSE